MSLARSFLAATLASQLAAAPALADDFPPFAWNEVGFTAQCLPNPALDRVLNLLEGPASPVVEDSPPEFDEPLANAVAANMRHTLELDAPIDWHGLRLVNVETFYGFERGPQDYSLVFRNNPDEVRRVWNALGWDLPAPGNNRLIDDEEIEVFVGIHDLGDGLAAITCFRD